LKREIDRLKQLSSRPAGPLRVRILPAGQ
jgi:hypothetical protein